MQFIALLHLFMRHQKHGDHDAIDGDCDGDGDSDDLDDDDDNY